MWGHNYVAMCACPLQYISMLIIWRFNLNIRIFEDSIIFLGREFQIGMVLFMNVYFLQLTLECWILIFSWWPLVLFVLKENKFSDSISTILLTILKRSTRSFFFLRVSKDSRDKICSRSRYGMFHIPGILFVKNRWTLSMSSISDRRCGDQTCVLYSNRVFHHLKI